MIPDWIRVLNLNTDDLVEYDVVVNDDDKDDAVVDDDQTTVLVSNYNDDSDFVTGSWHSQGHGR